MGVLGCVCVGGRGVGYGSSLRYASLVPRCFWRDTGRGRGPRKCVCVVGGRGGEPIFSTQHCHHQNDFCSKGV